jgi:site-specific recombinase XerD
MRIHPLKTLIEDYLLEKDIKQTSRELYATSLKQYCEYLKACDVRYAVASDVIAYVEELKRKGYSKRWIYVQISTIKGLYHYLSVHQKRLELPLEYGDDITKTIDNVSIKHTVSKPILTVEQAKTLINHTKASRHTIWSYRDHAIVYLMLTTGLRSVEVRRAKKTDLGRLNHQLVLYVQGKGHTSKETYVKISQGVERAINDYLLQRDDNNPYLFISHSFHTETPYLSRTFFIGMFRRVLNTCGLEQSKITPHSLRHTAATFNLQRGGSLEMTKQLLRHASLSSTLVYAHHIKRIDDDAELQIERLILEDDAQRGDTD